MYFECTNCRIINNITTGFFTRNSATMLAKCTLSLQLYSDNFDNLNMTSAAIKIFNNFICLRVLPYNLMFFRNTVYYRPRNLLDICKLNYSRLVRQLTCKQTIYFRHIVHMCSRKHDGDCFYPSNNALTCACGDNNV